MVTTIWYYFHFSKTYLNNSKVHKYSFEFEIYNYKVFTIAINIVSGFGKKIHGMSTSVVMRWCTHTPLNFHGVSYQDCGFEIFDEIGNSCVRCAVSLDCRFGNVENVVCDRLCQPCLRLLKFANTFYALYRDRDFYCYCSCKFFFWSLNRLKLQRPQ